MKPRLSLTLLAILTLWTVFSLMAFTPVADSQYHLRATLGYPAYVEAEFTPKKSSHAKELELKLKPIGFIVLLLVPCFLSFTAGYYWNRGKTEIEPCGPANHLQR